MTGGVHISRDELALFAMGALTREESAQMQAHVGQCAACREELARAQGDLALLAMSVEEAPLPAGVRERFLARVTSSGTANRPVPTAPARRRNAWTVWIPWAAVAALLVLAAGLEWQVGNLRNEVTRQAQTAKAQADANARAQRVLDVLTSRNAQHVVLTAAQSHPAPTARAVYVASEGALILQASNLAPVAPDKTYELWIIPANGKAPVPAGLFRPDAAGSASLVLPPLPQGVEAKAFGVTVEKASGSQAPTLPIVLSGAAPQGGE